MAAAAIASALTGFLLCAHSIRRYPKVFGLRGTQRQMVYRFVAVDNGRTRHRAQEMRVAFNELGFTDEEVKRLAQRLRETERRTGRPATP